MQSLRCRFSTFLRRRWWTSCRTPCASSTRFCLIPSRLSKCPRSFLITSLCGPLCVNAAGGTAGGSTDESWLRSCRRCCPNPWVEDSSGANRAVRRHSSSRRWWRQPGRFSWSSPGEGHRQTRAEKKYWPGVSGRPFDHAARVPAVQVVRVLRRDSVPSTECWTFQLCHRREIPQCSP